MAVGGLMGYLKRGSKISVVAGGGSAALFYYVYKELPENPVLASSIGIGKWKYDSSLFSKHIAFHMQSTCTNGFSFIANGILSYDESIALLSLTMSM